MKRRRLSHAPAAGDDPGWIYDTIAEVASPAVASGYERRIRDACQRPELGAERGTLHDDLRPGLRTIGFDRRVTVAFVVEEDRVVILRIFDGGRDWAQDTW